ncbi:MAG TPA: metallophosphoesterase, partial [Pyrinomonadaceae bacterium]|nr:metallophosphoesterase [Pyrinomonadaceae bacterium]
MRLSKRRKRLLAACVALLAPALALAAWAFYFEPSGLTVKERTLELPRWPRELDGLRVAVIADLHAGSPYVKEDKLRRLVAEVNRLRPDLVLMPGDFVIQDVAGGRYIPPETIAAHLKEMRASLG